MKCFIVFVFYINGCLVNCLAADDLHSMAIKQITERVRGWGTVDNSQIIKTQKIISYSGATIFNQDGIRFEVLPAVRLCRVKTIRRGDSWKYINIDEKLVPKLTNKKSSQHHIVDDLALSASALLFIKVFASGVVGRDITGAELSCSAESRFSLGTISIKEIGPSITNMTVIFDEEKSSFFYESLSGWREYQKK